MMNMVTANVALKSGEVKTVYANSFDELFKNLESDAGNIVTIRGKAILLKDMRQGKEKMQNGNHQSENRQP